MQLGLHSDAGAGGGTREPSTASKSSTSRPSACSAARSTASASRRPVVPPCDRRCCNRRRRRSRRSRATPSMLDPGTQPAEARRYVPQGDSAQYIVTKLGLLEAHGVATGKDVKIAVIDSEIDGQASRSRRRDYRQLRRAALERPEAASARHRHGRRDRFAPAPARHRSRRAHSRGSRFRRERAAARRAPA